MRTWFAVDVPKFYAPITSLLSKPIDRIEWQGLKTLGQLKREKGVKTMPNEDSLYKVCLFHYLCSTSIMTIKIVCILAGESRRASVCTT